jgi:hypothetical protein
MPTVSDYEEFAQEFLTAHPFETVITAGAMQKWVTANANGSIIKDDLGISDPKKRLGALRRHISHGGRSSNMAEDHRFSLEVEDAKSQTYVVRRHSDVVQKAATNAIGRSVISALTPLKTGRRLVDGVKLDELPEIERKVLEIARENILAMEAAVKPVYAQEVDRIWVAELGRRGISADQAQKIREALPLVTRLQKLLHATT